MPTATARVIVGMSGGVDSAVAALLLKRAGHHVTGLFMKNWDDDDGTEYCTAARDLLDADAACHRIGIDLETCSFSAEYRDAVFSRFLTEYAAGRTPNPDVLCNREIKFRVFARHAEHLGADLIATGHYARLRHLGDGPALYAAADTNKDQTYFLHEVERAAFARVLFPLGDIDKPTVRRIAAEAALPVHAKKDSTGICFIGERRFGDFLARYVPARPGTIVTVEGQSLGTHRGIAWYTLGQRQGLGIGGIHGRAEAPWYVVDKDTASNRLVVAQGAGHPALYAGWLACDAVNWLVDPPPSRLRAFARIRHRQRLQPCSVGRRADGGWGVQFDRDQRAITPGQSVALYADDGRCLGGGVITARGGGPGLPH